jgi:hypothetical protein
MGRVNNHDRINKSLETVNTLMEHPCFLKILIF